MKRVDFKKGFGIFLLVILGLTLFTGCSNDNNNLESNKTDTKNTLEKVIIAESARGMSWLPTYIAKTEGFFVEEGLDVEFITYNGGTVAISCAHIR